MRKIGLALCELSVELDKKQKQRLRTPLSFQGEMLVPHFKKILVAITAETQEQPVLDQAVQLAQHHHADLDVLEVVEKRPPEANRCVRGWRVGQSGEAVKQKSLRRLEAMIASLQATGLKVNVHTASGTPFLDIIHMVLRYRHDLVMKTIESERRWDQIFLGRTDLHLLRRCPSALWLVQPTESVPYRRILVAIDPDIDNKVERELGTRLLHLGTSLAQSEGAELLVGHAWSPFAEAKLKDHLNTVELSHVQRQCKQESTIQLQTFLDMAHVNLPPDRVQLAKGKADVVIPRLTKRHAVDLVMMGTLGRRGLRGLLIGNTAERLLGRIKCSILTLKPPEFVSPVSYEPR
jgi:nucleotide-binding universal stress UspA family protein